MKKLILSLALLLTVSMSAFAQEFPYNGINYKILSAADKTVEVSVSLSFNGSELIIPEKVINKFTQNEYTVTGIGESAFLNNKSVTSVSIPATVKTIQNMAFAYNTALQQVYMYSDDPSGYSFNAFLNCHDAVIYAPAASYEAYNTQFNDINKVEVELTEWKTYAENKIEEGLNALNTLSDEDRNDVNECLSNITTAVTFDAAYAAFENAMPIINAQINLEKKLKDAIGIFATRKNGPTIEIRANDGTTIKLYNIEKVNFGKEEADE